MTPTQPATSVFDLMFRLAYRLVYPVWRFYLKLSKRRTQGSQVAVWSGERVLLIRNSYRREYTFPGGYLKKGEDTRSAARRELREETGIAVPADQLVLALSWSRQHGRSIGHDDLYECSFEQAPSLKIDNREVVEASFFAPWQVPSLPVEPHVTEYLTKRAR